MYSGIGAGDDVDGSAAGVSMDAAKPERGHSCPSEPGTQATLRLKPYRQDRSVRAPVNFKSDGVGGAG